jgi:hypothetical protein
LAKFCRSISILLAVLIILTAASAEAASAVIQKIRFHQTSEKVRLVFDMTAVPEFDAVLEQEPLRLIIDMPAAAGKGTLRQLRSTTPSWPRSSFRRTAPAW